MSTFTIVMIVITAVLLVGVIVLYFLGKKAQKRQADEIIIRERFRNGEDAWGMGNYSEYCKKMGYNLPI